MAIIAMKKVSAVVLKKDARKVLKALQRLGVMQLSRATFKEGEEPFEQQGNHQRIIERQNRLAEVRSAIGVIRRYDHTKKSFLTPLPEIELERLIDPGEDREAIESALASARQIEGRMSELRAAQGKLTTQLQQLEPFKGLQAPVEELGSTRSTRILTGYVPKESQEAALAMNGKWDGLVSIEPFENGGGDFLPVLAVMHKSVADEARSELKSLAFSEMRFGDFRGTVRSRIEALSMQQQKLQEEGAAVEEEAARTAQSLPLLKAYEDYLANRVAGEEAFALLGATESANIIEGYIKHYNEDALRAAIEEITDAYILDVSDPAEDDENVPTALENKRLLRPFEAVTDMYSVPAYRGIDPVYVLAPFYFLLYGMMLSDAGYGVILSIGALLVLHLKKPTGMFRKVTGVLAICGISTVFWGLMFGGLFSIENFPALLFSPMQEPLMMLGLCLGIGFIHIFVALGTGFYMLMRDGHILDAIFDKGFWMIVLLGVPIALLCGTNVGLIVAAAGLVGILFTAGRKKPGGILKKAIGGLGALYDITGYLSDILSYSRIFGMALATSVIGMVFNRIAGMLMGGIGWVMAIAVLAVGHIFNIAINALGSYVHSARLQYIESFGRFFEGGGTTFVPLSYKSKNFRIQANH